MSEQHNIDHAPRCPSCGELLGDEPAKDYFVWRGNKIVDGRCEDECGNCYAPYIMTASDDQETFAIEPGQS